MTGYTAGNWRRRLGPRCVGVLLSVGLLLGGCSKGRSRTLSPQETMSYKRQLLRENPDALGEDQYDSFFGSRSASTKQEIDLEFEDFGRRHQDRMASERSQFLEERADQEIDGSESN